MYEILLFDRKSNAISYQTKKNQQEFVSYLILIIKIKVSHKHTSHTESLFLFLRFFEIYPQIIII